MPGFDYLIKWTCWDTVRALPHQLGYSGTANLTPFPKQKRGTQLQPNPPQIQPFQMKQESSNTNQSLCCVVFSAVLQLNQGSAPSLLAFIINSSFLNGVLKMVLCYLKKRLKVSFSISFQNPLSEAPKQGQMSPSAFSSNNSVPQPLSFAFPRSWHDIPTGEPDVGAACSREQAVISSRCEENTCISTPQRVWLKVTSAAATANARGKESHEVRLEFKAFQDLEEIIIISGEAWRSCCFQRKL